MFRRRRHIGLAIMAALLIGTASLQAQDSLWSTTYGGNYNEFGRSSVRLNNGDVMLLGSTFSYGDGDYDLYLAKTDSTGILVWSRTYGGSGTEYGYDIIEAADGGFVLVGSTTSYGAGNRDVYLVKVDASGTLLWSKTYGGSDYDEGFSLRETYDDGLIVFGTTGSFGVGTDMYLIRTDNLGDSLWTKTYGGASGESGSAVRETSDNGYIMIGNTGSYGVGYSSIYLVRADSLGDTVWTATYGNDRADMGYVVEIAPDNGFILGGATVEDGENYYDGYVVKTDADGVVSWDSTYGGAYEDRVYAISTTADGGFLLGGTIEGSGARKIDMLIIKIDGGGNTEWQQSFGGSESDYCRSVIEDPSYNYIALGYTYSSGSGGADMYLMKIQGAGSTPVDDWAAHGPGMLYELEQNYPNPFNPATTISFALPRASSYRLVIFNILGQEVRGWREDGVPAGSYSIVWDGCDDSGLRVASGVYLYRLTAGDYAQTRKMILLK